jgi:DNA-directed RNA polymerase subunit K
MGIPASAVRTPGQMVNTSPRVAVPLTAAAPMAALGNESVSGRPTLNPLGADQYTRFERARILGARALQISLGAPILIDVPPALVDPVEIAEREFAASRIPITVRRGTSA